jgi:hypothetical protein
MSLVSLLADWTGRDDKQSLPLPTRRALSNLRMKNLGAWTKEWFFGGGIAVTCQEPSDVGTDDTTLQGEIGAPHGLNLDSRRQSQPQTPP